ncbi:hypothetical protein AQUCO_00700414v1 [Aquilegia coerulea]|uniref:S-protein homolog n=1 Tax=Aquilegia coerulea TaxID=218851 RepID=A0A2G5EKE8_AQUCA|nr:hypothetical protein AQUCO_00700414v1 [Aquilegia coerulea]
MATNNNNIPFVFLLLTGVITACSSVLDHSSSVVVPTSFRIKSARVIVMNGLGPNNTLTIHCKSKDNDLGEQNIDFNKTSEWSFTNNLFGRTLFWCRMWWYDHHKLVWGSYRVYKGHDDIDNCGGADGNVCVRKAQWDGVYFVQKDGTFKKVYDWTIRR